MPAYFAAKEIAPPTHPRALGHRRCWMESNHCKDLSVQEVPSAVTVRAAAPPAWGAVRLPLDLDFFPFANCCRRPLPSC